MRSKTYNFSSSDSDSDNIIQVKDHKFPWWILLLLLPLLLLIPVKRNVYIELHTEADLPVAGAFTDFACPQHWPYKDGDTLRLSERTDSAGQVIFRDIRRPLYALIFCSDTAYVSSENECHILGRYADLLDNYPKESFLILKMEEKTATLPFFVADKETREPLPDAAVTVTINGNTLQLNTDLAGSFQITAPICARINITADKEYFYPNTMEGVFKDFIGKDDEERTIYLTPKKATITIYVRDKKTRQPLPGATVIMNIAGGTQQQKVSTNVNGAALVSFADLRLTEIIDFLSKKPNYADTILPPATVEQYSAFDTEQRTMYMRPLTKMLTFIDTDGVAPLPGVKNEIYINGVLKYTEYSNTNGVFTVKDLFATDKISIVASKTNYTTNSTKVKDKTTEQLSTQESRTIPLAHNPPPPPPPPANSDLQGQNGNFRVNLRWNTIDDLDLHVVDPCGNEIYYVESRRRGTCNGHTGTLDVDANAGDMRSSSPQENIYWDDPASGRYKIFVVYYSHRASGPVVPVRFTVTIIDNGQRREFLGMVSRVNERNIVTWHTIN